jgi:hypothetical protein
MRISHAYKAMHLRMKAAYPVQPRIQPQNFQPEKAGSIATVKRKEPAFYQHEEIK